MQAAEINNNYAEQVLLSENFKNRFSRSGIDLSNLNVFISNSKSNQLSTLLENGNYQFATDLIKTLSTQEVEQALSLTLIFTIEDSKKLLAVNFLNYNFRNKIIIPELNRQESSELSFGCYEFTNSELILPEKEEDWGITDRFKKMLAENVEINPGNLTETPKYYAVKDWLQTGAAFGGAVALSANTFTLAVSTVSWVYAYSVYSVFANQYYEDSY